MTSFRPHLLACLAALTALATAPDIGLAYQPPGKVTKKPDQPSKPKDVGPLSQQADDSYEQSQNQINSLRDTASNSVSSTSGNAQCTGALCLGSLDLERTASTASQAISAAAAAREAQAQQERDNIYRNVATGATNGTYSMRDVNQFRELFRSNPRPEDSRIEDLHPALHDAGYALRTNTQHLDFLEDAKHNFNRVADKTNGFDRKLTGISNNAGSFNERAPSRRSGGPNVDPALARATGGDSPARIGGDDTAKNGREGNEKREIEALANPDGDSSILAGAGGRGGAGNSPDGTTDKKGPTKPEPIVDPKSTDTKQASADDKTRFDAILKELEKDLGLKGGEDKNGSLVAALSDNAAALFPAGGESAAAPGEVAGATTSVGAVRRPATGNFASVTGIGSLDRSLFDRVTAALRKRSPWVGGGPLR